MDAAPRQNIARYAANAFKVECRRIVDESNQKMKALPPVGQGNSAYSPYSDDRHIRIYIQRVHDLVMAKAGTLMDAYELYGTPLDGHILTAATKFMNETLAGMTAAAKGQLSVVAARTSRNQQHASMIGEAFEQRLACDTRYVLNDVSCRIEQRKANPEFRKQQPIADGVPEHELSASQPATHKGLSIFISHSSKDTDLALALIELLKSSLGLVANQIRCSSVDGYRLPVGVNTESQLREEVNAAIIVIGLITPNSLDSAYVMFELGARWGANRFLAPIVAGIDQSKLSAPLGLLNALSAHEEGQLHQLLTDVSEQLGLQLQNTSSYLRNIATVKRLADATTITQQETVPVAISSSSGQDTAHIESDYEILSVLLDDYDIWQLHPESQGMQALLVSFYYDPEKSKARPALYAKASLSMTDKASGKRYVVADCCWIGESLNHVSLRAGDKKYVLVLLMPDDTTWVTFHNTRRRSGAYNVRHSELKDTMIPVGNYTIKLMLLWNDDREAQVYELEYQRPT